MSARSRREFAQKLKKFDENLLVLASWFDSTGFVALSLSNKQN